MTSKTAIQLLIEKLEALKTPNQTDGWMGGIQNALSGAIWRAEMLLPDERQKIIDAFNAGTKARYIKGAKQMGLETLPEGVETGEDYYNQTYGQ